MGKRSFVHGSSGFQSFKKGTSKSIRSSFSTFHHFLYFVLNLHMHINYKLVIPCAPLEARRILWRSPHLADFHLVILWAFEMENTPNLVIALRWHKDWEFFVTLRTLVQSSCKRSVQLILICLVIFVWPNFGGNILWFHRVSRQTHDSSEAFRDVSISPQVVPWRLPGRACESDRGNS